MLKTDVPSESDALGPPEAEPGREQREPRAIERCGESARPEALDEAGGETTDWGDDRCRKSEW
jgi:hypothetical protein